MNRRNFIKSAAVVGGAVSCGNLSWSGICHAQTKAGNPPVPGWVDRPMRWAQLTLVEDDPGKFDVRFWFDYFKHTRSDAICLSAGGCVAYYPTKIAYHHRSAWLGDRDVFGELVAGCRKMGMVVIARTDPHATYDDTYAAHPDWIAVDSEGRPRRHWASPEMWVTCALGPYNFEFMTEVKREIMTGYKVDGIFINRWDGSGMCYCENCGKTFQAATGHELPRTMNPQDPGRRAYILWRQQRLFELWQHWDGAVRSINPDSCVIPNTGGGATSNLDMQRIGELAPTLIADLQARRGLTPLWANGKNAKEYRATMGKKPIVGIFSVGVEEPYRWKDSVQAPAEIRLWVAEGVANGMRPWFTKFSGVLYDQRWLKPVEEIYQRYSRWEKYLRNESPLARVGVVYSQQTAWFHDPKIEEFGLGWCQALIERRIPFEMVHDRLLDSAHLASLKTLILPNIAALSDAQCAQLRAFVEAGGSIIATYETSLYNEWGEKRSDFGLAEIFGVRFNGIIEGPMQNSYLQLETDQKGLRHPILTGLESTSRIINAVRRVQVSATRAFNQFPLTLIPSYPDLPMEKVYPRVGKTNVPQLYLQKIGAGRIVYFPGDIDRTFWEVLAPDHLKLLGNAVDWATNEDPIVNVTGPGVLDVVIWRQRASLTIHLVNLTNSMAMKGPVRELVPIGEQHIRMKLPTGLKAKRIRLLAADRTIPIHGQGTHLNFVIPSFEDHEIVAIDI